jgi:cytoskeletal protein CcmA (bactofilin family)
MSAIAQSGPTFRTSNDVQENMRGTLVGTVMSVMETRNQFVVAPDEDRYGTVTIQGDSALTTYSGFGGVINGAPEVFMGSAGISNVREGDHVEVRGIGAANSQLNAERVSLLGRSVASNQVGVGQTRTPSSPATPTASNRTTADATTARMGNVEGVVRQVNADDNRIVIQTDRREMVTVRGTGSTPVYYRSDVYHIANLEVGDRVRITPESASSTGDIRARSIDVVQSLQDPSKTPNRDVGTLSGRVSRVDRRTDIIRVQPDNGRSNEVRVDLANALDTNSRRIRATDVQPGDHVTISGTYNDDVFVASTVNMEPSGDNEADTTVPPVGSRSGTVYGAELGLVTIYGTVSQPLSAGPQLVIRDSSANRTVQVYAADDLVVRGRAGGYTTADRLKATDSVVVKAYRDARGNLIAQTIRLR